MRIAERLHSMDLIDDPLWGKRKSPWFRYFLQSDIIEREPPSSKLPKKVSDLLFRGDDEERAWQAVDRVVKFPVAQVPGQLTDAYDAYCMLEMPEEIFKAMVEGVQQ